MSDLPLVAICTPVYNGARFLREAMDGVQAQTYPNIIHVIVDNASTDDTPKIIEEYRNKRVPLHVIRNAETVNANENWNRVMRAAPKEAKYLRLFPADDRILPEYVERVMDIARRDPNVGVVGCGLTIMEKELPNHWPADRPILPGKEAIRRYLAGDGDIVGTQLLVRADMLDLRERYYVHGFNGFDTEAALFCLTHSDWGFAPEQLAWTRVHDESLSHKVMHKARLHFMDWYKYLYGYGPMVFAPNELAKYQRAYRRYYLRRLIRWLRQPNGVQIMKDHMALMGEVNSKPTALDFADASVDLVLKRLKLREPLKGGFPLG